jgi:hypothetical protein
MNLKGGCIFKESYRFARKKIKVLEGSLDFGSFAFSRTVTESGTGDR